MDPVSQTCSDYILSVFVVLGVDVSFKKTVFLWPHEKDTLSYNKSDLCPLNPERISVRKTALRRDNCMCVCVCVIVFVCLCCACVNK